MSDITLSSAVRSNLLSLQNTASMMETTQGRLATGKKVNSALDNPTNFFTSSSLNSRAGDMNALLDGMANGIQTLEAADNGLKSVTKTLESMQSTLRQARQDKSFQTTSFNLGVDAPTGSEQISFSGGAVGSTAIEFDLFTNDGGTAVAATNATATGTSALSAIDVGDTAAENATVSGTSALTGYDASTDPAENAVLTGTSALGAIDASGGDITFDVNGETVTLSTTGGSGGDGNYSASDLVSAINTQVGVSAGVSAALDGDGNLALTSTGAAGSADSVTVDNFSSGDVSQLGFAAGASATASGTDAVTNTLTFDVNGETVTLDATGGSGSDGNYSAADLAQAINDQVGVSAGVAASIDGDGNLVVTSTGTAGASDAVTVDNFSSGDATQFGFADAAPTDAGADLIAGTPLTFDINGETVTLATDGGTGSDGNYSAADIAQAINDQVGTSAGVAASIDGDGNLVVASTGTAAADDNLTIGNFSTGDATQLGLASAAIDADGTDASISGGTNSAKSIDALVEEINSSTALGGAIRASNDNGKLRIENLSTQDLSVGGFNATSGEIDGDAGSATIGGNSVRAGLAAQFNELRDQLDKLADDASFNGINLLRGDNLNITFNETGTSQINIQTEGGETINSQNLGIQTTVTAEDLDSDDAIDTFLGEIKGAINEVRSQASSFGSNLSVVENRQEFTKNMINTLETGAANLTLADSNEEAANLLALQTRQQLSSTALSMASQQDQSVLRLF